MYFMNDDMATFSAAMSSCQAMGGDLVSLHSSDENSDVLRWGSKFLDKVPMFFGGWLSGCQAARRAASAGRRLLEAGSS